MPIYEFKCGKCGKPTEVMQKLGERPPPCPHCGSRKMTRAVSRTSFALKGGGWYADLYATPKPGEKKQEGGEPASPATEKAVADKAATPAKPGETAKPAATPAPAAPQKGEAAPRPASSPPGRRSTTPRKRR